MNAIQTGPVWVALMVLFVAFFALTKSADYFVDSAVGIASRLHIPRLVIGLILVSFATTSPELSVSLVAARYGNPEMALGNAIGSVICNCGIALGICGLLSRKPVPVVRRIFLPTGTFLFFACCLLTFFVWRNGFLGRGEGLLLFMIFVVYSIVMLYFYRRGDLREKDVVQGLPAQATRGPLGLFFSFALGLGGVVLASRFVVVSAVTIAGRIGVPESIIALTLVAFGTSVPEVATSVVAAIKGEGALSIGNILGANIMNICWVAGASAVANPLIIQENEKVLMFPALLLMVGATLVVLYTSNALSRREGLCLLAGYGIYLASFFVFG